MGPQGEEREPNGSCDKALGAAAELVPGLGAVTRVRCKQAWSSVAGGSAHADHGMDVRNRRGTKCKAARTDEVLQVLLTATVHSGDQGPILSRPMA